MPMHKKFKLRTKVAFSAAGVYMVEAHAINIAAQINRAPGGLHI